MAPSTPAPRTGLWRNTDFRNLWFGLTASLFGAKITAIAVPLIASRTLHASPLEMGALVAMEYVPYLVLSLPAGVWLDRRPKRPLLILSDVVRAGLLMSIPVSWLLDLLSVPVLLVMALLIGALLRGYPRLQPGKEAKSLRSRAGRAGSPPGRTGVRRQPADTCDSHGS